MSIISMKISPGIYISEELLKKAGIDQNEVKIEVQENLIRIYPAHSSDKTGPLAKNSPLWDNVAMEEIKGGHESDED